MTEFVTFDHAPDSKRYFVVRRPGIAVSLTAVIVPADSPLPPAVMFVVAPDGRRLVADCITVHRAGDDRECPALPGGCDSLGEAMPGAGRLLREWAAGACQPHSMADALVEILHRETGEATAPTAADRAQAAAEQLPTVGRWPGAAPEPVDLDALTALADAATRGPWTAHPDGLVWAEGPGDPVSGSAEQENADFIAATRTAVPELIAEVRRLRAELDAETTPLGPLDEPEIGGTVRDCERDEWTRGADGRWLYADGSGGSDWRTWDGLVEDWGPIFRVLKAADQ